MWFGEKRIREECKVIGEADTDEARSVLKRRMAKKLEALNCDNVKGVKRQDLTQLRLQCVTVGNNI